MPKIEPAQLPIPSPTATQRFLRKAAFAIICLALAVYIYWDAPLEGEYRGSVTDAISGRGVLVLRNGQMLIRSIDGDETPYATYNRRDGTWIVPAVGGSEWRIERGLWGFRVIFPNGKAESFRRLLPFENPYVEFTE